MMDYHAIHGHDAASFVLPSTREFARVSYFVYLLGIAVLIYRLHCFTIHRSSRNPDVWH
jgi:hypothetical protein